MEFIGIDVHKNQCQVCKLNDDAQMKECSVHTDRLSFAGLLGNQPSARILIEASTESEWVARCIEGLGHNVIVADPNYQPMYGTRNRKVKTDRRDARALAEACRLGVYRKSHRVSDEQRHVRRQLSVREALVRSRAKFITMTRTLIRGEGYRVAGCTAEKFVDTVAALDLPESLREEIKPLVEMIGQLNKRVASLDRALTKIAEGNEDVCHLRTLPGIGPVTALAFTSTLDNAGRFHAAGQVTAYLGLVPREYSSGEKERKGAITKMGHGRLRYLLVQAAWCLMRSRDPRARGLKEWAQRLSQRRGKHIAMVALARRLARILFAMMRDKTEFRGTSATENEERNKFEPENAAGPLAAPKVETQMASRLN